MRRRMLSTAYVQGSGSPVPLDRNTPSGFKASTSYAVVCAGTTVTVEPYPRSLRRMFCLMPKSYATTVRRAGPRFTPGISYGERQRSPVPHTHVRFDET